MMQRDDMTRFSLEIEEMVWMLDISHMEAIVEYCTKNDFEMESAAKLISPALKEKIKLEAEELHFLPRSETIKLPL